MKPISLNRALIILMMKMTIYSTIIAFSVYYLTTWVAVKYYGRVSADNDLSMTGFDWFQFVIINLLSLIVSTLATIKLSRKIIHPLLTLADASRKISSGELSARAVSESVYIKETTELISDFNSMAQRLEHTSGEIKTWNAAIAHELRTPVTILHGRLQGLSDGVFFPDEKLYKNLLKQVEGLARIIEDLRTISLAESGYLSIKADRVNIKTEIACVIEAILPALTSKFISPVTRLDNISVLCDPVRIRQAILAILDNVTRYAQPGIVLISSFEKNDCVIITVEDEGKGVEGELQQTLFEPFRRAEDSRSREYGGSGLGLAVVNAILRAHGGNVAYFKSELGGAGFRIELPTK